MYEILRWITDRVFARLTGSLQDWQGLCRTDRVVTGLAGSFQDWHGLCRTDKVFAGLTGSSDRIFQDCQVFAGLTGSSDRVFAGLTGSLQDCQVFAGLTGSLQDCQDLSGLPGLCRTDRVVIKFCGAQKNYYEWSPLRNLNLFGSTEFF
jgi:hypothetical protein